MLCLHRLILTRSLDQFDLTQAVRALEAAMQRLRRMPILPRSRLGLASISAGHFVYYMYLTKAPSGAQFACFTFVFGMPELQGCGSS